VNDNSLKEIFSHNKQLWMPIFKKYLHTEEHPNFSVYRKPYNHAGSGRYDMRKYISFLNF